MIFRHIINQGNSSRWDVSSYLKYRDVSLRDLSPDLRSMVLDERFSLGAEETFWRSDLVSIQFHKNSLDLTFINELRSRIYEFKYLYLKKVINSICSMKAMPVLMIQELVLSKDLYRHALVDLLGRGVIIYAENITFKESLLS